MANIFIYDEFNPEDNAMLQALYSRSGQSVTAHVDKVRASGSGKFMETFYVNYGHQSIADCGSTTVFIEGLSILADKAVQDSQMYSGQETSTRYIDMSKQPIIDPLNNEASKQIIKRWMDFYTGQQEIMAEHIRQKYPKKPEEDQAVYDKAIKARVFDSLRGFLPAGIATQLSWHTNLRQAYDKLALMRYHPLAEVREVAEGILKNLQEKYSHSFGHQKYPDQEKYREDMMTRYNYFQPLNPVAFACQTSIKNDELIKYQDIIDERPIKTNLPVFLEDLGQITFNFNLDYGSFRDVQRHRHGVCRMPLLTTQIGFNPWYLEQLPTELRAGAEKLISEQIVAINQLATTPEIKQYYTALGFNVACQLTYGLPATVYVVELRSSRTVHPTLRQIAFQMHSALLEKFPSLKLHSDLSIDDWDVRRGLQDITTK